MYLALSKLISKKNTLLCSHITKHIFVQSIHKTFLLLFPLYSVLSCSVISWLSVTPQTVARLWLLYMELFRQVIGALPFSPPGDISYLRNWTTPPVSLALVGRFSHSQSSRHSLYFGHCYGLATLRSVYLSSFCLAEQSFCDNLWLT